MEKAPTTLPECHRYLLTHTPDGTSVVHSSPDLQYRSLGTPGGVARSYSVASVPVDMSNDQDLTKYLSEDADNEPTSFKGSSITVNNQKGTNLLVLDMAPGSESPMHQTVSVDFSICVLGHVGMELDNGEVIHLKPSDHVIQRGTMHRWFNESQTEPARILAVVLAATPIEIGGKPLEEVFLPAAEKKG